MFQLIKTFRKMSFFYLTLIFLSININNYSIAWDNKIFDGEKYSNPNRPAYFNKIFEQKERINFQINELIIGEISKLLVVDNGNKFVIYDKIGDELLLVNCKKKTFKKLSIEDEIPGERIKFASFCPNLGGGFWVSSYPKYYIFFDNEGTIKKIIPTTISNSSFKFGIYLSKEIIAISREWNKPQFLISINVENNKTYKLLNLDFDKEFDVLEHRMPDFGGLLIDKDGYIYIANALENKIYKYNNQKKINVFKSKNNKFKIIENDFIKNKDAVIELFRQKMQFSSVMNIFFLNDDLIFITYLIEQSLYFEIFNKNNGKIISSINSKLPGLPLYGSNNNIYIAEEAEVLDENGNVENPILYKYQLKKDLYDKIEK